MNIRGNIATAIVVVLVVGCGGDASPVFVHSGDAGGSLSDAADATVGYLPVVPPSTLIFDPSDGAVYQHGDPIELVGKVTPGTGEMGTLSVLWVSDLEGVLWQGAVTENGVMTWTWETSVPGAHTVTLMAIDLENQVSATTVSILVNDVPDPPTIKIEPVEPTTADDLKVELVELAQDANKSDVLVYQYAWFRDGGSMSEIHGDTVVNGLTARGETWRVEVTVSDGHHVSEVVSDEVEIVNAVPSYEGAAIFPEAGGVQTTFTCAGMWWNDPDGDEESATVHWEINYEEVLSGENVSLSPGMTKKGDWIRCAVVPFDTLVYGNKIYSPEIAVSNTPPSLLVSALTPTAGEITTAFSCVHEGLTDPDEGDVPAVETLWFLDGEVIVGANGEEIIPLDFGATEGQVLSCRGVPTDGFDVGLETESGKVELANAFPTVGNVWVSVVGDASQATEFDVLQCHVVDAADPGGGAVTVVFEWQNKTEPVVGENGIAIKNEFLDGDAFDKGDDIRCVALINDESDALVTQVSENAIAVVNLPPSLEGATVNPPTPSKNTELACLGIGWFDPDPTDAIDSLATLDPMDEEVPGLWISWWVDGELVVGENEDTLTSSELEPGNTVACSVTPFDGQLTGEDVLSDPVVIVNHIPTIAEVTLHPLPAYGNTLLGVHVNGWEDEDGDAPGYFYAWKINGVLVEGVEGATLSPSLFGKGDAIQGLVIPWDGYEMGEELGSDIAVIQNHPPALSGVELTPATGGKNTVYSCVAEGVLDADPDDSVTFFYAWYYEDGTPIEGLNSGAIFGEDVQQDAGFYCTVTPYDGTDTGSVYNSNLAIVINAPPTLEGALLEPPEPTILSALTCSPIGFDDPDGDDPVYKFKWFRNNVEIPSEGEAQLLAGVAVKGDTVFCQITPGDGDVMGLPVVSNAIVVKNAPPSAPTLTVTPEEPVLGDELICEIVSPAVDPDGDGIDYETFWLYWGMWVLEGPTLESEFTDACGDWTCAVVAVDEDGMESDVALATVSIHSGFALGLDGTGAAVIVPQSEDAMALAYPVTIEAWVRRDVEGAAVLVERIGQAESGNGSNGPGEEGLETGHRLWLTEEGVAVFDVWEAGDVATTFSPEGGVVVPLNAYVHIAGTYDGEYLRVWVDGELGGQTPAALETGTSAVWTVGNSTFPGYFGLDGAIDDLRISDVNRYPVAFTPTAGFVDDDWTVAFYPFEEGTGLLGVDVAQGNDASLTQAGAVFVPGMCWQESEPPGIPVVTIAPEEPTTENALVCQAVAIDPEGDPLTYIYQWSKDGTVQPELTGEVLPSNATSACEEWTCQVAAQDGVGTGPTGSATVSIQNAWTGFNMFGYDVSVDQVWVDGFSAGEMFGWVTSFPADEYPILLKKVFVTVVSQGEAVLHLWEVSEPSVENEPIFSAALTGDEINSYEIDANVLVVDPQKQLRVGVESSAYLGLGAAYRSVGSGLHLVKTCDAVIPEFGCIVDSPKWKPANALTGSLDTFWEIHLEVETVGGAGFCE